MNEPNKKAFEQMIDVMLQNGNQYALEWRQRIDALLQKSVDAENASGNKTLFLTPMHTHGIPSEDYSAELAKFLLPVILSKDTRRYSDRLESVFEEEKIVGLARVKLYETAGTGFSYMHERIAQLFPLRDEMIDSTETDVSCKYYLPLLYRYLEETDKPSSVVFDMERKWINHIQSTIPVSRFLFQDREEKWRKLHNAVITFDSATQTGTTAALRFIGISNENIPFPIEFTTEDVVAASSSLKEQLTKFGKVEIRQFGINHPSGSWYLSVVQLIVDERLIVMLYNLTRFMMYGTTKIERKLSSMTIMAQLCYAAWLLERRGIDRSKWIYAILLRYREILLRKIDQKEEYTSHGSIIDWPAYYFRQSKQVST